MECYHLNFNNMMGWPVADRSVHAPSKGRILSVQSALGLGDISRLSTVTPDGEALVTGKQTG